MWLYLQIVAMHILFCSCLCTVCSKVSDSHAGFRHSILFFACYAYCLFLPMQSSLTIFWRYSQASCNLSLAFLADFTALIRFIVFIWIKRHDHSVHMSSVLQVQQFYTMGTPLLEAYLLPMANNQTRNERLSQEQNVSDRQTDTQTKYCNPRCACAPRVNYLLCSPRVVWQLSLSPKSAWCHFYCGDCN